MLLKQYTLLKTGKKVEVPTQEMIIKYIHPIKIKPLRKETTRTGSNTLYLIFLMSTLRSD